MNTSIFFISVISIINFNSFSFAADNSELAKQLANPVANLISLPLQFNFDEKIGANEGTNRYQLNIQPVVPIKLNEEWNVISRTILPITFQSYNQPGIDDDNGTGDIVQSLFFSPSQVGESGLIWGLGPALLLPTASKSMLGADQFGLGPTFVVLKQTHGWTFGALGNHIWGIENKKDRDEINNTFIQPFLSYTYPSSLTVALNTETNYDWNNKEASIPINLMVTQIVKFGDQLVSLGGGARYWAEDTNASPKGWGARIIVSFIFPK